MARTVSKSLPALFAAIILAAATSAPAAPGWQVSYAKAAAEAKKTGKLIMADFTGSDWCGWCIKLTNEVFKTPQFKKWAAEHVVPLYLDFPRRTPQSAALKKQNTALAKKYGVRGFPTVLFLTPDGGVVGRAGYVKGGPEAWIESVQPILDRAPKPQTVEPLTDLAEAQAAAAKAEKPMLVLAAPVAAGRRAFKPVLADNDFATFANAMLVTVQTDSAGGVKAIREKHEIGPSTVLIALIDPTGETVYYKSTRALRPDVLKARLAAALPKPAYGGEWLEDYDKAKRIALAHQRPILLDFTGSDWCTWCKKLDAEVFAAPGFKKLAAAELVLMKVDLPRRKKLPDDVMKQNRELVKAFGVRGFPTMVLVDASGAEKGRLGGFPKGGLADVAKWIRANTN